MIIMKTSNICIIGAVFLIALLNVLLFIFYDRIGMNNQELIWFVIVELIVLLCVGLCIFRGIPVHFPAVY